jgi:protein involved in polysaccharide export with SLBB domain
VTLAASADKKPGSINVRVEGEHQSPQEYVLPYGSRMGGVLSQIQYSERSDSENVQLFRLSVKERQKQMLNTALKSLESAALTARSGTSDEARLRKEEADLLLQWVDRARKIEPSGQVVISQAKARDDLLLENGDIIRVPTKDGLVLVSGEVLFPNAIAFDNDLGVDGYISRAGGYTQNADSARVVIAHRDGSFAEATGDKGFFSFGTAASVHAGDEILVLPRIDVKYRQIWKDMTQIIYQIAVSAKVVLGL